jgi:nucleotide-binding universal stress UspA family protein
MRGTLVCAVNDNEDGRAALEMAVELSDRLGLRLVLAPTRDGIGPLASDPDDAATLIGQIAAEEAADLIVVGARKRRWSPRGLRSRLAEQLGSETPVPVLIAPPRRRSGKVAA